MEPFDQEITTDINSLPEFLRGFVECSICYKSLEECVESTCCHSLFCSKCVKNWNQDHKSCPFCRNPNPQYKENIPIQRITDQLPLTCCYKVNGCNSIIASKDYQKHILTCQHKKSESKNLVEVQVNIKKDENVEDIDGIFLIISRNAKKGKELLDNYQPHDVETKTKKKLGEALYLYLSGKLDESETEYKVILEETIKSHGENHLNVLSCYEKIALIAKKKGNYQEAIKYYKKIIQTSNHLSSSLTSSLVSSAFVYLADVKRKIDDFSGAEVDYQSALKEKLSGEQKFMVMRGLGLICKKRNQYSEALEYYNKAKMLKEGGLKEKFDYDLGVLNIDIGDIYRKREDHKTAIQFYDKAIENISHTVGNNNLDMVDAYYSKSLSLMSISDLNATLKLLTDSQNILKKYDHYHYKNGLVLCSLGQLYSMKSNYKEAFKYLTEGGSILIKTLGEKHLEVADVYTKIGECALKEIEEIKTSSLETSELLKYLNSALEIYKSKFDDKHYKVTTIQTYIFILGDGNIN